MPSLRIVIADDDRDSAEMLAVALRSWGHEAEAAYDGDEAILTAERMQPDVVLLDLAMPALDGIEVATHLRARPWGKSLRLIAITGRRRAQDFEQAEQAGFEAYLVKPIELASLERLLRNT